MNKKVLGVYNSSDDLIRAVEEYKNEGYSVNQLSIIANTRDFPTSLQNEIGIPSENVNETDHTQTNEPKGFMESLVSAFEVNSNTDGSETSYYDYLTGLGIEEAAAREYEEDINSGRILLLAEAGTGTVTNTSRDRFTGNAVSDQTDLDTDDERTLKLREEQLDVSKERVQTGEVNVHKEVVEEEKTVHVPVTHEEVYVERRAVSDASTDTTTPVGEDETIRVPIVEEKVEVTKKPVVTEELVIGKRQATETEQVTEKVQREKATVETDGDATVDESVLEHNRTNSGRL